MLVGGALWFLSGWDQGPTLLAVLGPYCTLLAASPFPAEGTRNFIRGTLYAIPAALLCKFLLLPLINGFPLLLLCLAFFWSFGIQATTVPRRALQGIAYLIAFNTLVATGNLARFDFGDFANQSCAWVLALCISLLVYRLLPKDMERHSASLLDHLRRETLALLRRRAGFDAHAWQARQQHRIAQLGALHGMEHPRSALALRLGFVSLQLGRESRRLWRALAGLDPAAAEARWIERALRAIAVRHRDPPLAARARRAGARLAAAGEWRLAAILTDLAWLLRAYSQSVSSDGRSMEKRPHENLVLAGLAAVLLVPGPGGGRRRERVAADRALRLRHAAGHRAGAFRHAGAGHLWRGAAGDALPRQRRTPTSLAVPRPWRGLFAPLRSGRRRCLSAPRLR